MNTKFAEEINVGIIGGGTGGSNLLEIFLKMDSINIKYVADIDVNAPAMVLAKKEGLKTTTEIMDILNDKQIDLIIEVTGSKDVLKKVNDNKMEDVDVIAGHASFLLFNIIEDYKESQQNLLGTVTNHLTEVHDAIRDNSQDVKQSVIEIEKVTSDLNMLAINASIEAAHAGESGKGFSVVAGAVKDLAGKSSGLVSNIQEVNQNIINLNENITDAVNNLQKQSLELED
ncbi:MULTISPECIES: methyl-accepting chemotaxis protein [unclassified Candidatus Frackibacter]|uniref:methyl-accepting chemotaxis protein n=1 Tax=unclassified Candidatus Frackibacter TaxID=2648818 RepID=UPI000891C52B|nr:MULTISPECIES: methyl-accepting chemotaxis protein [unclassified Candidatus Frackibacter]SDB98012.1 Methyl-accepting chemotaxis protein (MCP) signalling domain-containing protein [Candidatus Frackibacter sp. WG11]SEM29713.1 Methyl-accepting chemotaxis protein (MCP) signalling domain-containing protein [Candidatus Frackibacter sp. WG12]SFL34630.1 Methyl-accepting chemotaxis protein (MCP) signalling domain-containing protein [Candidatus Frackibacter sp. WG13]